MEAFEKQYKKIDKDKSGKIDKQEWMAFISEVSGLGENPFEKAKNANQEFKDLVFEVKKEKEQEKNKEPEPGQKEKDREEREQVQKELIKEMQVQQKASLARRNKLKAEREQKVKELMAAFKKQKAGKMVGEVGVNNEEMQDAS